MTRTPREVLDHHLAALRVEDLDGVVADYSDDAVFITASGAGQGRQFVRQVYGRLLSDLPRATWLIKTEICTGDIVLLEWAADAGRSRVEDGISTLVLRRGLISAETSSYTLLRARI